MIISASPCLKYSRPRFASSCPSQQSAQISPVISDAFLRFIGSDNQNELTRLKRLSHSCHASPVQRGSFNHILWATDAVSFTPYDSPIEDRCLKILVRQAVVSHFVFSVNREDILSSPNQRSNLPQYTGIHRMKVKSAP